MASKFIFLTLLLGFIKITIQNPVDQVLGLDSIETLLQNLNSQTQKTTNARHQRKPSGSHHHHAAHTKHETGKPELMNLQNLNLIFKHNNLGKLLRSAPTEPQPLQQRAGDSTCSSPGRCGCGGNRCDDDLQYATRQGDGQDLESLINALKQVLNSKESQARCSGNRCGVSALGRTNNNDDQDKINDRDIDQEDERSETIDKKYKLIEGLLKQLEEDANFDEESRDEDVHNDRTARDLNDESAKIIGEILAELDQDMNVDTGDKNYTPNKEDDQVDFEKQPLSADDGQELARYSTTYNINDNLDVVVVELPEVYGSQNSNVNHQYTNQGTYNNNEKLLREKDRLTSAYNPTQKDLVAFYQKYTANVVRAVVEYITGKTKKLDSNIYDFSVPQTFTIEEWKTCGGRKNKNGDIWTPKVKELLFGSQSGTRVVPHSNDQARYITIPQKRYEQLLKSIQKLIAKQQRPVKKLTVPLLIKDQMPTPKPGAGPSSLY